MKAYIRSSVWANLHNDMTDAGCDIKARDASFKQLHDGFDIPGPAGIGHNCDGKVFILPPESFYYVDEAPAIIKPVSGLIKPQ